VILFRILDRISSMYCLRVVVAGKIKFQPMNPWGAESERDVRHIVLSL